MPPKKPEAKGVSDSDLMGYLAVLVAGLLILSALVTAIFNYLGNFGAGTPETLWARVSEYFLTHIWPTWKFISLSISIFAIVGIVYNSFKLREINIKEKKIYDPEPEPASQAVATESKPIVDPRHDKWVKVMNYLNSSSPSDWRLSIIEADVMLEEVLRLAGYYGESVGEMLKSADKNDFITLDEAWEAHKMRNTIAHAGGDFQLTEREAKRIIALFERVFKEFLVI